MAGELRLRTVEEVESKEWRREDASRMHPQGLMGARVLAVEPRPVGGGIDVTIINSPINLHPVFTPPRP